MFRSLFRIPLIAAALVLGTSTILLAEEPAPAKPYPLDTCLVSGAKLGSMGEPPVIVHEGQEIKFCCSHCIEPFKKDPAKYLAKMEEAQKKAPATQPAEKESHGEHH